MKIHEIIRKSRKEKGLTQEELARYLGVSAPAVNKWEKGQSYPDITLLPVMAAYFNLSVDELLGYEPQMTKEDIKKLYHRMAKRFGTEPFETVKEECEEYIRKYHSCFPLLLQVAVLYLNHFQLAAEPGTVLDEIIELLDCVIEKSDNVNLGKEATLIKGMCYLIQQKPEEVLDMLGEEVHEIPQEAEMQAQAYKLKGDSDKATEVLQVCMYQHLLTLLGDAAMLAGYETQANERTEKVIRRTLAVMDIFHVDKLHFNVALQTYLAFAQYYCIAQKSEDAVHMLERYAECVISEKQPITLHGDEYFDKVDRWLSELALGKEPPREDTVVRQSVIQAAASYPTFECLKELPNYQHVIKKLEKWGSNYTV